MILDFGCGSGRVWTKQGEEVIGIDINSLRLKTAKERIQVVCCDGRDLPFKDRVFRRVIADSVLEHIQGYRRALGEIKRVISKDGQFTLVQPVDNDPLFFLARRVARNWNRDKVSSKFTSGYLLRVMSGSFRIESVNYLPNSPIAGILGFFHRRTPPVLSRLDAFYRKFARTTRIFHWEVVIEASPLPCKSIIEKRRSENDIYYMRNQTIFAFRSGGPVSLVMIAGFGAYMLAKGFRISTLVRGIAQGLAVVLRG